MIVLYIAPLSWSQPGAQGAHVDVDLFSIARPLSLCSLLFSSLLSLPELRQVTRRVADMSGRKRLAEKVVVQLDLGAVLDRLLLQ